MAVARPEKIPRSNITSLDIVSFDGGLDQRGQANIRSNSFSRGRNVMVNEQGLATHRYGLKRWLPDTLGTAYQVFPVLYGGEVRYYVADYGKVRWCREGDFGWTDCGGLNTVTTTGSSINTFLRIKDSLLILNGTDRLAYVDLATNNVVRFDPVVDPTTALTATLTKLTTGDVKVYYAYSYNSTVGVTKTSPITTVAVNKERFRWAGDGTEYVTVTRPAAPANAVSWNLYIALAPAGVTIATSDMLPLAEGIDLATTSFSDNGSMQVNLDGNTAPEDNSTEGPKAKYGLEIEGRAFLYGVTDDPYAIYIGGVLDKALDFSPNNGGYRLVLNDGTNFFPMSVVGFRNGQGLPSITVLFSNTQGLSKQSIIEQQTVTYGSYSFVVWGQTEQNYGAAGVSSPYAVVNYKGMLAFPSTDGIVKMDTQASLQNVLSTVRISDPVIDEVGSIKSINLPKTVGGAWGNRVYWSIASRGFDYNNEILIYDVTRKDGECWYVFDIRSQWIGVVTPQNSAGFVYICQDNHIFRLQKVYVAQDEAADGTTVAFPLELETALIGSNTAHDGFYSVVQAMFYLVDFVGEVTLSVTYRDYESGRMRTKSKTVSNGSYAKSAVGGWSSSGYLFNQNLPTSVTTWGDVDKIDDAQTAQKSSLRIPLNLDNVVTNEMSASVALNPNNSSVIARSISFQGKNLGISPDSR